MVLVAVQLDDVDALFIRTPADICETLNNLLSDRPVAKELGEKARQWVTANYTMDSYRDSLIQFLSL